MELNISCTLYSVHIVHKYFPSIFFCVPLFFMKNLEAVTHAGFLYIVLALSYDFTRVHLCLRGWVDFYAFFGNFDTVAVLLDLL